MSPPISARWSSSPRRRTRELDRVRVSGNEEAEIRASRGWNEPGITIEPGGTYDLETSGEWVDFYIRAGAEGYDRRWLRSFKRCLVMQRAPFLAPIGRIGDSGKPFRIGARRGHWHSSSVGTLYCAANDLPWMYWNNFGSVQLRRRRCYVYLASIVISLSTSGGFAICSSNPMSRARCRSSGWA